MEVHSVPEVAQTTNLHKLPPLNRPVQVHGIQESILLPFCWGQLHEASRMKGGEDLVKTI